MKKWIILALCLLGTSLAGAEGLLPSLVDTIGKPMPSLGEALSRYPVKGAILHSDRGSQYTSGGFRETLEKMGIQQSLSGVAHCYDNARMESFFATLKKELLYRIPTYRMTVEQVKTRIFRYVFTYYNQMRVYTSNPDGLPPAVYRRMQMEKAAA